MKKYIIAIMFAVFSLSESAAQEFTKSYMCTSVITSMGAQVPPAGLATCIEFYDDYIMVMGVDKFTYGGKNPDGSSKYWATRQGPPALNTVGWLVSQDYNTVKQVVQSSVSGMTMEMDYLYSFIGEGCEPAFESMQNASQY